MIKNYKKDFPIFKNNPDLVFLDSTASSQKPSIVIDGIKDYLENDYSNIHRGFYDIAEKSEKLYLDSKKKVLENINANSIKEIIYTYNSTYALNFISSTLEYSNILKKGDKILITQVEHHANIVPWLILKDRLGIELEFVNIKEDYSLDIEDFKNKYDETVKVISFTQVSNVTGEVFDLEEIGKLKRKDTIFIVDASQSIPHFKVDVSKINCDILFFTGHKIFADSGIGVIWGKEDLLNILNPYFSGGGAIGKVTCSDFTHAKLPYKFEAGTPNITGAVSLLRAFEYIESIGGYKALEEQENSLVEYFLDKMKDCDRLELLGSSNKGNRVGVFSFYIKEIHSDDMADMLAEEGIAVRSGMHCAHTFFDFKKIPHSFRVSLYIYNDKSDVDKFFNVVKKILDRF